MIDPFTAMAAATSAYKGIKKAIEVGKEISSMGSTLSSWSKAVSDLDFLDQKAQKPPMYKMFSDTQSNALEIWTQKQKLKEMREELRSHISFVYGPSAWDEIVRIEAQQRKEQRDMVYAKQEAIDSMINTVIITAIMAAGIAILGGIIWFLGHQQGNW
jgi:hypothetical protein|tara:strand:+ start:1088 stop:1561 length:474 start_codon:yes stop_codon:yes gene_type:complete